MSTNNLPAQRESDALAPLKRILAERKANLEALLPKGLKLDRFLACIMNSARKTPAILGCSPESLFNAARQSAELGLEPDSGLGHAYLVPYGKELTFVPGYKGWVYKLYQCAQITVRAVVVYAGEHFVVQEGTDPKIEHVPLLDVERPDERIVGAYATARLPNGQTTFVVLTRADIDKVRSASKSGRSDYSPWSKWYPEMAKKTAIKRIVKILPIANEDLSRMLEAEDADALEPRVIDQRPGAVRRSLSLRGAEEPEEPYTPPVEEQPPEPGSEG